jgi:hypothetical protein
VLDLQTQVEAAEAADTTILVVSKYKVLQVAQELLFFVPYKQQIQLLVLPLQQLQDLTIYTNLTTRGV